MLKKHTRATSNIFNCVRLAGVTHAHDLINRGKAAELLGIGRTRLGKIETGESEPYPEEVLRMADIYSAPELLNYFCSRICPIGKDNVPYIDLSTFDRMARKGLAAIRRAKIAENILIRIAPDGEIRKGEETQLLKALHILQTVEKVTLEMEIYIKKNLKGCE